MRKLVLLTNRFTEDIAPTLTDSCLIAAMYHFFMKKASNLKIVILTGTVAFRQQVIYRCTKPLPPASKPVHPADWKSSHFWAECGGTIIDLSFFRRIYAGEINEPLKSKITESFGFDRGAMIASSKTFEQHEFQYIPEYSLSIKQMEGIVTNTPRLKLPGTDKLILPKGQ